MRYKRFDVIDCDMAKLRHSEDRHVFRRAWQLKRILVTHDADFLNDRVFPLRECAGLLVLPTYGAVSMEFGNLLAAAAALISRGENLWLHTKIEATRGFVLKGPDMEEVARSRGQMGIQNPKDSVIGRVAAHFERKSRLLTHCPQP